MTTAVPSGKNQPLQPRQNSLARSSLVMAAGTLTSRLLGFVRNALLIAAIGVGLGAADAFQAANSLPNSVYNLLAAGVFNAVLIPQIVRALKKKGGIVYVNRLITAAATILFSITVVAMVGAPILISVTSSGFPPEVRSLAITFAIWCLPQIFFYGLYNLWGEVLNARGMFGPYMWAPVVNNIVAIAGLGYFIYLWGPSQDVFPAESFTGQQMWVLAGTATLGVVLQAFSLLWPLSKSGVKLRPDFNFRGTNFGSASKVAFWTFMTLLVSQLGVLSTTNIASQAVSWGAQNGELVASLPAYNTAFMIYMVPQSLISVTLATAVFTRLALNVSDGNFKAVAYNYHTALRMIMLLTMVSAAVIIAAAVPIMQMVMPTFTGVEASLYANVLIALMLGVPSTGIVLISQRVFYAFENARPVFLMGLIPTALQLIIGWSIFFLAEPQWWTVGAAAAETACRVLQGFIAIFWVAHFVRTINAGRMIAYYITYLISFGISAFAGWLVLRIVSPISSSPSVSGRFTDSLWKTILTGFVVVVVYFGVLRLLDPKGFGLLKDFVAARLPSKFRRTGDEPAVVDSATAAAIAAEEAKAANLGPGEELTSQLPLSEIWAMRLADEQPEMHGHPTHRDEDSTMSPDDDSARDSETENRLAIDSLSRSASSPLSFSDPTPTGQIPIFGTAAGVAGATPVGLPDFADLVSGKSDPWSSKVETPISGNFPLENSNAAKNEGVIPVDQQQLSSTNPNSPSQQPQSPQVSAANTTQSRSWTVPAATRTGSSDQGTPPASPPQVPGGKPRRFDPMLPTIVIAIILVILGLFYAISVLKGPATHDGGAPGAGLQSQSSDQSGQSSGETPKEPDAPATTPPTTVTPVIAEIEIFSWSDDGKDHPELTSALTDGDPGTYWYTRYYDWNQFTEESVISILVNLQEEAVVDTINLNVIGSGGEITIRDVTDGNPRQGTILATATLNGDTVIKLSQPTKLSALGINFVSLPTDDEGLNRAKVTGISID